MISWRHHYGISSRARHVDRAGRLLGHLAVAACQELRLSAKSGLREQRQRISVLSDAASSGWSTSAIVPSDIDDRLETEKLNDPGSGDLVGPIGLPLQRQLPPTQRNRAGLDHALDGET